MSYGIFAIMCFLNIPSTGLRNKPLVLLMMQTDTFFWRQCCRSESLCAI